MPKKQSSYEGLQKDIRTLKTPKIDVWYNQYADKDFIVNLGNPEFTCVCPKSGLPDFAGITIQYKPDKWCVELKSFKMYMLFYRNIGIFHEHLINKVLDDFVAMQRVGFLQHPPGYLQARMTLAEELPYPADLFLIRFFLRNDLRQIGDFAEPFIGCAGQHQKGCGGKLDESIVLYPLIGSHLISKRTSVKMSDISTTYHSRAGNG